MPPQAGALDAPPLTPLAPSVEKAYYRKCIELKRRLNEVEAANDEAKLRRLRLDRAIMKMRLERALLLDELRKRTDLNVDGSDGSGDEGISTPPPDRPHRDKRRRQHGAPSATSGAGPANAYPPATYTPTAQRTTSDPSATGMAPGSGHAVGEDGRYIYDPPQPQAPLPHGSPYGPPPTGLPSAPDHTNGMDVDVRSRPISRQTGTTGEVLGAGSGVLEENGERRLAESGQADGQQHNRGGFSAVNG